MQEQYFSALLEGTGRLVVLCIRTEGETDRQRELARTCFHGGYGDRFPTVLETFDEAIMCEAIYLTLKCFSAPASCRCIDCGEAEGCRVGS